MGKLANLQGFLGLCRPQVEWHEDECELSVDLTYPAGPVPVESRFDNYEGNAHSAPSSPSLSAAKGGREAGRVANGRLRFRG